MLQHSSGQAGMAIPGRHRKPAVFSMPHKGSESAPAWCSMVSRDINEQADNLTDWEQEYDQYSAGCFFGRIDECHLPGIQVVNEFTSQMLHQNCVVWPESLWIGLSLNRQGFRINGQTLGDGDIMWRYGDTPFELVTPADCNIISLVVNRDELYALADTLGIDLSFLTPSACPRLTVSQGLLEGTVTMARGMLQADGAGLDSEIHRDLVLQHILALLEQASVNEETPVSYGHRKRVVDRVRSYLEDAGDQPVTMTQLCEIACVSRRTLQYSFETILGISPVQYLRRTRLNRVRRRLLLGLDDSVADAAASQGFYHLSQFSLDYKRLFGERPSDTFRASVH